MDLFLLGLPCEGPRLGCKSDAPGGLTLQRLDTGKQRGALIYAATTITTTIVVVLVVVVVVAVVVVVVGVADY